MSAYSYKNIAHIIYLFIVQELVCGDIMATETGFLSSIFHPCPRWLLLDRLDVSGKCGRPHPF